MKRFRIAFEEIAAFPSLLKAWRRYRSGKRRRPAVAAFEVDLEARLLALSDALMRGTYRHAPYRLMRVTDPKPRLIAVASVRDRVLHTAVHDALAPQLNRSFISESYACLPGRGSHRAILRYLHLLRRRDFVLHLDIHRYFPSIEHHRLLALLERRLKGVRTLELIGTILASGDALYRRPEVREFFDLTPFEPGAPARGLPIGNLTSQWLGNLYLDGLDHFIKRELKVSGYLRYLDDFVLFADSRTALRRHRSTIRDWLRHERGLELNPKKMHIRPTRLPQTYLGYRITARGFDLGPKAYRRFVAGLPDLLAGDAEHFERAWASWYGAITF